MNPTFDLNCDLAEWETPRTTTALMRWITSANVACGGHAGTIKSMTHAISTALSHGVRIGAHPGVWDKTGRGRATGRCKLTPAEFELLLLQQVSGFERILRREGGVLHHIKLHGALYHATETDETLARAYLDAVARWWPDTLIYAKADGRVARLAARSRRHHVWEEGFLDRSYRADGSLVDRTAKNALLKEPRVVRRRLALHDETGELETAEETFIQIEPDTWCVHADTPASTRIAKTAREFFEQVYGRGEPV